MSNEEFEEIKHFVRHEVGSAAESMIRKIEETERIIMSKMSDLAGLLTALDNQVETVAGSVQTLESELQDADLSPEAQEALDKLTADTAALAAIAAGGTQTTTTTVA